jgi:hypothetical protein
MELAITSYAELIRFVEAFRDGLLHLLIVVGPPGVAKSATFRNGVPDSKIIQGTMSPLGLYRAAYEAADAPLIIDDIDMLYTQPQMISLMKALCQTEARRTVSWKTGTAILERLEIPDEFETSSPIAILANSWDSRNPNVRALGDRGHVLDFRPTNKEIHENVSTWFDDEEVLAYFETMLPLIPNLSMRQYATAATCKGLNLDWRQKLTEAWKMDSMLGRAASILADPSYGADTERIVAFAKAGGSRATWYRAKKMLLGA